jgi:predicted PurR-regulated permease PerM
VLVPILSFFLLKDAQAFTQGTIRLLPDRWRSHVPALLDRVDAALAAYIRAQLVACLLVGTIVGVGFSLLHIPFAAVLGVAAGVAEFLPLVGPLVVALVSGVIAALHAPATAIVVLLFLGVLRVLEDYVIYPRLIGSTVHLHPFAVILAMLAGGELGGVVGVLLSVPFVAIASAVYHYLGDSPRDLTTINVALKQRADANSP